MEVGANLEVSLVAVVGSREAKKRGPPGKAPDSDGSHAAAVRSILLRSATHLI